MVRRNVYCIIGWALACADRRLLRTVAAREKGKDCEKDRCEDAEGGAACRSRSCAGRTVTRRRRDVMVVFSEEHTYVNDETSNTRRDTHPWVNFGF